MGKLWVATGACIAKFGAPQSGIARGTRGLTDRRTGGRAGGQALVPAGGSDEWGGAGVSEKPNGVRADRHVRHTGRQSAQRRGEERTTVQPLTAARRILKKIPTGARSERVRRRAGKWGKVVHARRHVRRT